MLAETFFQILDSSDLSLLARRKRKPIFEPMFYIDIFDNIMNEYEQLSGNRGYSETLDKVNFDLSRKTQLTGIIAAYYLFRLDKEKGIENLSYWGINVKNNKPEDFKMIESMIKSLKTNIQIDEIRNKNKEKDTKFNFDQMIVNIENAVSRNIQEENLTVSKWVALIKSIEKRNSEYEKIKNNGRNY